MQLHVGGFRLYARPAVVFGAAATLALILVSAWIVVEEVPVSEALHSAIRSGASESALVPLQTVNKLTPRHPIDELIDKANEQHAGLLLREKRTVNEAAAAYRARRGRHPPPRFDEWFSYAKEKNSYIIEDLFDRIYDDLEPFWGVDASVIRQAAASGEDTLSIRNGALTVKKESRPRLQDWHEMLSQLASKLPDVDMVFNLLHEPRTYAPWEKVERYMTTAQMKGRYTISADGEPDPNIHESFPPLPKHTQSFKFSWVSSVRKLWSLTQNACPPETPGRTAPTVNNMGAVPSFPDRPGADAYSGFVSNWTAAKSPCRSPHLQGLHGAFIEPINLKVTQDLFPIFGGAKTEVNNDILVPAAQYWDEAVRSAKFGTTTDTIDWYAWDHKKPAAFWRGAATGGRNKEKNWRRFHRHRFVSMNNASQVATALSERGRYADAGSISNEPRNFPVHQLYWGQHSQFARSATDELTGEVRDDLLARSTSSFPDWLAVHSEASFTDLACFPAPADHGRGCAYDGKFYALSPPVKQNKMFKHKYIPDLDGDGLSPRYRSYLISGSVPVKATIFNEWHDSRLIPWKHFVPMHNDYMDWWGILQYFVGVDVEVRGGGDDDAVSGAAGDATTPPGGRGGSKGYRTVVEGHDAAAEKIAKDGRDWARRVLRKEDMLIYMYRLVLEYARLCSDDRDVLGYVKDLEMTGGRPEMGLAADGR